MRNIDRRTIVDFGVPGCVLMENAGRSVVTVIKTRFKNLKNLKVVIVTGKGNNGGDGFVVARWLRNLGTSPECFILGKEEELKGDAKLNFEIIKRTEECIIEIEDGKLELLSESVRNADLVVDAIFGTGFKGRPEGIVSKVIEIVNRARRILSIDCPSGLDVTNGSVEGVCVKADITVSMCLPKLGLFFYPGKKFVGELWVVDIGAPKEAIEKENIRNWVLDVDEIANAIPQRQEDGHKGDFGYCVVVAGSVGMTGAAALTSTSVLKSGAGLVTLCLPESMNSAMESKLTEVMTYPLPETKEKTISKNALKSLRSFLKKADVVTIGPGISTNIETRDFVRKLIKIDLPLVIDADGLNCIKLEHLKKRLNQTIITPHPGELSELTGMSIEKIEKGRVEIARDVATEYKIVVALKGAPTVIAAHNGDIFINPTGNSGLATAGSGDVLTGIISSFLAQGASPVDAAKIGVYLHGVAGDLAAKEKTEYGMMAQDIVDKIPSAVKRVLMRKIEGRIFRTTSE